MAMQRYTSIAAAFAFGYFFTLGLLTIGWVTVHQPHETESVPERRDRNEQ